MYLFVFEEGVNVRLYRCKSKFALLLHSINMSSLSKKCFFLFYNLLRTLMKFAKNTKLLIKICRFTRLEQFVRNFIQKH